MYEEEANHNSVAFSWINNNGEQAQANTIISDHKMMDLSIAEFNRINKTGGNIWDIVGANTQLCCMSLKWEKKEKIDQMNAYNAFAKLKECIGIDSNSSASIQLKNLFERHFTKGLCDSDDFYDLTITTLEEPCDQGFLAERSDKTELNKDLVKLLYEDREGMPPLTISEIMKYLNTKKIIKCCLQSKF